jgi:multidrug efflux pump subunit AcrA (membrane-fusion protein)
VPIEEPHTYVVVPNLAVRRAAYATFVFTVTPDEKDPQSLRAHQRFVTLGQTIGEDVIVLQGLKPGERIAGAGSFKLREGAKVAPGAPAPTGQAIAPASGEAPATASAKSDG